MDNALLGLTLDRAAPTAEPSGWSEGVTSTLRSLSGRDAAEFRRGFET